MSCVTSSAAPSATWPSSFHLTPANCPHHPSNCTLAWIDTDLAAGKEYFLLEIDGQPAGCVAAVRHDACTGKIERLAVLPRHRRAGCGGLLLDHALQHLRGMGLTRAPPILPTRPTCATGTSATGSSLPAPADSITCPSL